MNIEIIVQPISDDLETIKHKLQDHCSLTANVVNMSIECHQNYMHPLIEDNKQKIQ